MNENDFSYYITGTFPPTCNIQLVFLVQDMLLDEKTGCLLKFSGELEEVSREDFHELFSGHGKIKWVDFTRGAKEVNKRIQSRAALFRGVMWFSMEYFLPSTRVPYFLIAMQNKHLIRPKKRMEEN